MMKIDLRRCFVVASCLFCLVLNSTARADDAEINGWIKHSLRHDERVDSTNIHVATRDGIVTLSGQVPTLASGWFAIHEAQKIRGVVGITNELIIATEQRPDTDIVRDIEQRISHNATIVSKDLHVGCLDGFVTLSGEVADYAEELEAELVASEVRGVRQVQNHLVTGFIRKHDDQQTQRDVAASLARDVFLSTTPVAVTVKDSVATLTGKVNSAYVKRRAEDEVRRIETVKKVINLINVDPTFDDGEKDNFVWPTEEDLEAAVKLELADDSRVDAAKMQVSVEYGHVVLDGVTRTHREKRLAELDARGIIGVQSVANNLVVNGPQREDSQIEADVVLDLASDAMLHGFDLKAKTNTGTVTLTGDVDTLYQRDHTADLVGRVRGVVRIDNQIQVDHNSEFADDSLAKEIVVRWNQNNVTHICAPTIKVEVINGVAVLTGTVESWAEHQEAARVAFYTDGIWKVENHLIVEGFDYPWDDFREENNRDFDPADPAIQQFLFG